MLLMNYGCWKFGQLKQCGRVIPSYQSESISPCEREPYFAPVYLRQATQLQQEGKRPRFFASALVVLPVGRWHCVALVPHKSIRILHILLSCYATLPRESTPFFFGDSYPVSSNFFASRGCLRSVCDPLLVPLIEVCESPRPRLRGTHFDRHSPHGSTFANEEAYNFSGF